MEHNLEELISFELLTELICEKNYTINKIAEIYNSSPVEVEKLKSSYNITNSLCDTYNNLDDILIKRDKLYKDILCKENIGKLSKAVALFAFRDGPIENIQITRNLDDNDMMTLNKHFTNRMAYFLSLIIEEKWTELKHILDHSELINYYWDEPEIDDGGVRAALAIKYEGIK